MDEEAAGLTLMIVGTSMSIAGLIIGVVIYGSYSQFLTLSFFTFFFSYVLCGVILFLRGSAGRHEASFLNRKS